MQRIQEKQTEVWEESVILIEKIKNIDSKEDLVSRLEELEKLIQNAAFLKISEALFSGHEEGSVTALVNEVELQDLEDQLDLDDHTVPEAVMEKMDEEYFEATDAVAENTPTSDPLIVPAYDEEPNADEKEVPVAKIEMENHEAEVNEGEDQPSENSSDNHHTTNDSKISKIKLAHIKGLHVESLFGEETIQRPTETHPPANEIPEKQKQDFKLDLNDRMAFSKMLFGGSQSELNETIRRLNTYQTLDDAKQYLSEVYYERNWKKADEYAQRLWSLVEHKFL